MALVCFNFLLISIVFFFVKRGATDNGSSEGLIYPCIYVQREHESHPGLDRIGEHPTNNRNLIMSLDWFIVYLSVYNASG